MPAQVVPTPDASTPFVDQTTTLDGVPFILNFAYNQRQDCWYLSIATVDGSDVWNGIKLVCNWDLLLGCADPRRPAGKLFVVSNSADTSTPGLADIAPSGRCALLYLPLADVEAIAAGTTPP